MYRSLPNFRALGAGQYIPNPAPCDAASRQRVIDQAKLTGDCYDACVCSHSQGRVLSCTRVCQDDPVEKARLINQIKADEIEAAALESLKEKALEEGGNTDHKKSEVAALAQELQAEAADLRRESDEADQEILYFGAERLRLASLYEALETMKAGLTRR